MATGSLTVDPWGVDWSGWHEILRLLEPSLPSREIHSVVLMGVILAILGFSFPRQLDEVTAADVDRKA